MKIGIKEILIISRPRFWMYVAGTFLVGMIAAGNPFAFETEAIVTLVILGIFFSLPANLFIYGVNDIYDYDTDRFNNKKIKYENLLMPEEHKKLWNIIIISLLPFLSLGFLLNFYGLMALAVFMFTGFFYSARPIRAKSKPPLDIVFSSIIYVSPAVIGFFATGSSSLDWLAVLGGLIWASAMQTYSAVPDIEADNKAGVKTLATQLGGQNALFFCFLAFLVSAIIGYLYVGYLALIFGLIYSVLMILSIVKAKDVFKYYTYFPLVNTLTGALLYFYLFLNLF
ncbi:MAG: prenyltransferase [Bacteroidota bacterium]